jgi:pimeloyl-ACP methyl ester carboxylesterase
MPARALLGVTLAAVLTLAGCGLVDSGASPEPIPTPTATAQPNPDLSRFYEQDVRWTNCGNADCARIKVPVDYNDPEGPQTELAITRVPAKGESLGALFVNPGGPGGSAFDYAKAADFIVTPQIRENFDIVGLDPRGVGYSNPIRCLTDEEVDTIISSDDDIDTPEGRARFLELAALPGQACAENASDLYASMSTVNAARDLDIARAALGEASLNYLGKSYGSMLGAYYAELFPDRVGRMVLDGILSPEADAVETVRIQSIGLERAAEAFMTDCLTHRDCPFSGSTEEGMQQLRDFYEQASDSPIPTQSDRALNGSLAAYATLMYLYFPSIDYPILRAALARAIKDNDGTDLLAALDSRLSRSADGRYEDNFTDAYYAVTCLDQPYLGDLSDAEIVSKDLEREAPTFGPGLALGLIVCADWPASEPDPITRVTAQGAGPILVLSATEDPVTPLFWAEQLTRAIPSSVLITYDTFNHTIYFEGSACVDIATDSYLLTGTIPDEALTCAD